MTFAQRDFVDALSKKIRLINSLLQQTFIYFLKTFGVCFIKVLSLQPFPAKNRMRFAAKLKEATIENKLRIENAL